MRKTFAALAAAALVLGVGGTASAAQTSAPTAKVYACVLKKGGDVRIVTATTICKPTERRDSWARYATAGQTVLNPQGARGETGAQGPKGDPGVGTQGPTGPRGWRGLPGTKGSAGPVGPTGPKGADGVDGKNGADGKGLDGPFVLDLNGLQSLCAWDGSVKGYPRLKCKLGVPTPAPSPTPTPAVTPSPTFSPTAGPTNGETSK